MQSPQAPRSSAAPNSLSRRGFALGTAAAAVAATSAAPAPAAAAGAEAVAGTEAVALAPSATASLSQRCLEVARALLVRGPDGRDLVPGYREVLVGGGLPRSAAGPKKVLVVGAGPAGLVTALLLRRAGHTVTLVEANGNRAGGRIKTFRTGGHERAKQPFADPRQYAEAGAMRIPQSHPLVMALIDHLGVRRQKFRLVDEHPDGSPAQQTWIHVNGIRVRRADYARSPRRVNQSFGVPRALWDVPAAKILSDALDPARDEFSTRGADGQRTDKPAAELLAGWARVIERFGDWSMRRYLTEFAKLDEATIDLVGCLENVTSRLPLSFLHSFLDAALISPRTTFWELSGGTAALPDALLKEVEPCIRFDRRVTRIEYWDPHRPGTDTSHVKADGPHVWVDTVSEGRRGTPVREQFTADLAVITVPFSGLRHIQVNPLMSYGKRRAVTELHYDSATKVVLEFSRRWWEFTEEDWKRELATIAPGLYDSYRKSLAPDDGSLLGRHDSVTGERLSESQRAYYAAYRSVTRDQPAAVAALGGGSVSDNPNRFTFNPSHPVPGSAGGVVLAAYTWADDAMRWDAFDDDARYPHALSGLQDIYGQRIEVFYTGAGQTQSWARDPYAYGEASVLLPGQHTELFPEIVTPEGPLHFAGDHTSLKPAWIEGAVESAVRAALEVHTAH
ncbi:FAD-dependent oxidoreductase [Streptomyces sp. ASQP_92]|uniref:flavin monoamine oxidase family protein n=1 Tax=Streptomyces sp. ASQP_92 TaxID=2979116 RepID=UPI0021BFA7C8|nr:FAD-dependent oxidoreductase [Streptomyces sp. ASQP_92]MCT9092459.1 FAD-dependent oxidoreductase [Streptomyces sp. ASQP_92]